MSLQVILQLIVGVMLIIVAILAIEAKRVINSVIYLTLLSLLTVVGFVLMNAPDVAITEAVIGSGLVTFLFVFTLMGANKLTAKKIVRDQDLDIHGSTLDHKDLGEPSMKGGAHS